MQKSWFVVKEINIWEFVPEFSQYLWVNKERKQITPSRDDEEKANEDFAKLGFKPKSNEVNCYDDIRPGKTWVRHIVQCGTIY